MMRYSSGFRHPRPLGCRVSALTGRELDVTTIATANVHWCSGWQCTLAGLLHWRPYANVRRTAHSVLTICGLKGGIGKSAVATNLSAWWSAAGQRVLLIDADPNGSATKLHARGEGALLAAGSAVVPIQQAP